MIDMKVRILKYIPILLIGLYATKKLGNILPLVWTYLEIKAMQRETTPLLLDKSSQTDSD